MRNTGGPNMIKKELDDYFHGYGKSSQKDHFEDWMIENRDSSEINKLLSDIWDNTSSDKDSREWKKAFNDFKRKVLPQEKTLITQFLDWSIRIAAILFIPLLISLIYFAYPSQDNISWVETYVPYGQTKTIQLPDGTKAWLNSGTRIFYPEKFSKKTRSIYVSGEAFLDVHKDSKRPFHVSISGVDIQVLGTRFNIKSYDEDIKVDVSLLEGSVKMSYDSKNQKGKEQIIMKPGNYISYNKTTKELVRDSFNCKSYTSWKDGQLYFRDETLKEIASQLERIYNVKIIINDQNLSQEKYYVALVNNESLDQIVKALNVDGRFYVKKKENSMEISIK